MNVLFLILLSTLALKADPRINSWFTADSGAYARIFETTADETAGNAVTVWDRGQGVQAQSTYAGIHEISSSANWVYLRSTGLASHTMGPWYLNEAKTNLFPNYPANTGVIYRIPRTPNVPAHRARRARRVGRMPVVRAVVRRSCLRVACFTAHVRPRRGRWSKARAQQRGWGRRA